MSKKPYIDFSYDDYKDVKLVVIEEELTEEELEEGLVPEAYDIHICLTSHSLYRMNDDFEREIEWNEIEPVILGVGENILQLRDGERFELFSKERDIKVVGIMRFYDGKFNLIIKTVIRVLLSNGSYEKLKPTKSRKGENTIINNEK